MVFGAFRRRRHDEHDRAAFAAEVDTVLRVLANYAPDTKVAFGAPTRCPSCGNYGVVEHLDRVRGVAYNQCLQCRRRWEITRRALHAARTVVPRAGTLAAEPWTPLGPSERYEVTALGSSPDGVLFSRTDSGDVRRRPVARPRLPRPDELPRVRRGIKGPAPLPGIRVPDLDAPMRVLLVEDDPYDIDVVRAILEPAGPSVIDLSTARTRADGEQAARSTTPDVVLLDLGLPDSHGRATVTEWQVNVANTKVFVVSGQYSDDVLHGEPDVQVAGFIDKSELAELLAAGDAGTSALLDRLHSATTNR